MIGSIDAYNLNWNPMTVEAYNEQKNEVTMIFNFDMSIDNKVDNVIKYVVGRAIWCHKNYPLKATIILAFDLRGQSVIVTKTKSIKNRLMELLDKIDISNEILIEFYT